MKAGQDRYWRKAQMAARLLLTARQRPLTPRERRAARALVADPGVTDRLIDQALASETAGQRSHVPAQQTVEAQA